MVSKFEFIGILGSVALMALALFLLRVETTPLATETVTANQAAVAVVAQDDNEQQALFETLADSVNTNGDVEKLVIDDVLIGSGREVATGDTVSVHYIGRLQNGQEFDNSYNRGEAFTFTVGQGRVIKGWELGVVGMKVGGQRILVIPPTFGYGSSDVGPIPGDSTLIFAIELLSIQ